MHIVSLCGSLRRGSFNRVLTNTLPSCAPEGMTVADAPSIEGIPFFHQDRASDAIPEPVTALADAIRGADGIVIATPEYNAGIPGLLKNAIDWVSWTKVQPWQNKPVAIMSASPSIIGGARAQQQLRQILGNCQAFVLNKPEVYVAQAGTKIAEDGATYTEELTVTAIKRLLSAFKDYAERLSR